MTTSSAEHTITEDIPPTAPFPAAENAHAGQVQAERPNKYMYPPFAGYSGERYLDSILMQILPAALWRTWHYAVDFQAPGNPCYVGATRISQRVKPGVRKIEIDLHEFEARGLMRRYAARLPVMREDGSFRHEAVVVKDFSVLYALAYEYHLWTESEEHIAPERAYADLILADPALCDKVIRFDNYRRLLCCGKPGRKAQPTPIQLSYQTPSPQGDPAVFTRYQQAQNPGTEDLNPNNYFNPPVNISSPYRESRKEEISSENVSDSTNSLEAGAIGKEPVILKPETKGKVRNTDTVTQNRKEETKTETSKPEPVETPQKKEAAPEAEKAEKEYTIEELKQNPVAMTAFLLDLHARQTQQPKPAARSRKPQEKRKKRGTPEQLARYIAYVVQQLGGNPKNQQSDITCATKIYWAATQIFDGFTNAWFLDMIREAFVEACRARGVKRRVPYFFRCLENRLELSVDELVFIRSQEPLYRDGNITSFKTGLVRAYEKSGTQLEYLEWVQDNYLSAPAPKA